MYRQLARRLTRGQKAGREIARQDITFLGNNHRTYSMGMQLYTYDTSRSAPESISFVSICRSDHLRTVKHTSRHGLPIRGTSGHAERQLVRSSRRQTLGPELGRKHTRHIHGRIRPDIAVPFRSDPDAVILSRRYTLCDGLHWSLAQDYRCPSGWSSWCWCLGSR